jgi:hypothetical protein
MPDKLVDVFLLIFQTRDQTSASPHFAKATRGRPHKGRHRSFFALSNLIIKQRSVCREAESEVVLPYCSL